MMSDRDDDHHDGNEATDPQKLDDGTPGRTSWEDRAVFRETFLALHPEPEIRTAFRRVGVALYEGALAREESYVDRGEPPVAAELRAAALDLRVVQGYLGDLGRQAEADTQDVASTRLCLLAEEVADDLGTLLSRIRVALGPAPTREG